jgi:hypothetical protein
MFLTYALVMKVGGTLQSVPELLVRLVREVVLVGMLKAFHRTGLIPFLIFPDTNISVHNSQQPGGNRRDQNSHEARRIHRCVFGLEEQGSDEVAYEDLGISILP